MKVGRELDILVAQKVMGWSYSTLEEYYWFKPSTNLLNAWLVVEKLGIAIIPQAETAPKEYKYLAKYYDKRPWENPDIEAFAETAPLAICLAALKAVGVELG